MSSFINRIHAYVRESRVLRRGASVRADAAPRGQHKEYARMPRVTLPNPTSTSVSLESVLQNRSSFDRSVSDRAFSQDELGTLLGLALGARKKQGSRNYPSAGAQFPIETYVIGNLLEGVDSGVFHYHPGAHALEHLWPLPESFDMSRLIRPSITPLSSTFVIFTSVWERSAKKYGDFAYSHALLEAGHMAQNILLVATAIGAQCRPVAGCEDPYVAEILDLDPETEQFIYGVLLSPPSPKKT